MKRIPLKEIEPGNVPCDGCVRCCINSAVKMTPGDVKRRKWKFWQKYVPYEIQPHPYEKGAVILAHKADKTCVYLGDNGCTIYDTRPFMCREMDCRVVALRLTFTQARKIAGFPIEVWHKGRELLKNGILEEKVG